MIIDVIPQSEFILKSFTALFATVSVRIDMISDMVQNQVTSMEFLATARKVSTDLVNGAVMLPRPQQRLEYDIIIRTKIAFHVEQFADLSVLFHLLRWTVPIAVFRVWVTMISDMVQNHVTSMEFLPTAGKVTSDIVNGAVVLFRFQERFKYNIVNRTKIALHVEHFADLGVLFLPFGWTEPDF